MRTLIVLSLCALAAVCMAALEDSSSPGEEVFVNKPDANNFNRRFKRNIGYYPAYYHYPSYESVREIYKSPMEVAREYCDGDDQCGKGGMGYLGYMGYMGYMGKGMGYYRAPVKSAPVAPIKH